MYLHIYIYTCRRAYIYICIIFQGIRMHTHTYVYIYTYMFCLPTLRLTSFSYDRSLWWWSRLSGSIPSDRLHHRWCRRNACFVNATEHHKRRQYICLYKYINIYIYLCLFTYIYIYIC